MSGEESDLFQPTRIQVLREIWGVLKNAKDLPDAQTQFKNKIVDLVLGED